MVMFHETMAGKRFLEGDFPNFVQQLKIANEFKETELKTITRQMFALEEANKLKEKEIAALEKANILKEHELFLKEKELKIKRGEG